MRSILQLCVLLLLVLGGQHHAWGKIDVPENIASGGPAVIWVDDTDADAPPTLMAPGEPGPCHYDFTSDVRNGPNLYAYVKQNPWTAWDPHGLAKARSCDFTNI